MSADLYCQMWVGPLQQFQHSLGLSFLQAAYLLQRSLIRLLHPGRQRKGGGQKRRGQAGQVAAGRGGHMAWRLPRQPPIGNQGQSVSPLMRLQVLWGPSSGA